MSFLRPEAVSAVLRWVEPLLAGGIAIWLASAAWGLVGRGNPVGLLALIGAAIAAAWCVVAALRKGMSRHGGSPGGPGVVTLREGQIGYFGPDGGGFVAVDSLVAVDLIAEGGELRHILHWRFSDERGQELLIPQEAEGAEYLLDAINVLPRLDYPKIVTAMFSRRERVYRIWRRSTGRLTGS